jgi:adenylate cyclase
MNNRPTLRNRPVTQHNSRANFERLLGQLIQHPEQAAEINRTIEEIFGQDKAVMMLDLIGFTRTASRHGIVAFLQMIHHMQMVVKPCVEEHHGLVVKAIADSLLCVFDTAADALDASLEIDRRLREVNNGLPEERRLFVSVGIGYGHLLNVGDEDLFGSEVNLACKLGEDIGGGGDILLTEAAYAQVSNRSLSFDMASVDVSGVILPYCIVRPG